MEKNTLSINCAVLIPQWCSVGVGIGKHSGHCCSEIAFTGQSTEQAAFSLGSQGPYTVELYTGIGQYTLSLV